MFRTRIVVVILAPVALLLSGARDAAAQQGPIVAGQRVRLDAPDAHLVGTVGYIWSTTPDTIVLVTARERPGQPHAADTVRVAVARSQVRMLEVSRRSSWSGTGAALGSLVGLIAGGLIGSANASGWFRGMQVAGAAMAGGAGGGLLGAVIGASISSERWERVPLAPLTPQSRLQVGVGGGRVAVGASLAF